jgi:hypothetical protein
MKYFIRGYLIFDVNGHIFFKYSSANRDYNLMPGSAYLYAWHILWGWRAIKIRQANKYF